MDKRASERKGTVINGITIYESFAGKESLETILNRDIRAILLKRPDILEKSHALDKK